MPFQFTCPHCYNKTLVDESYIGQTGPCASCGKSVTIMAPAEKKRPDFTRGPALSQSTMSAIPRGGATGFWKHPWVRRMLVSLATLLGLILFGLVGWKTFQALSGMSIVQKIQQRSERTQCMNNASRIARALEQYAATHGTYPPPITYDQDGKPMHSWRVLILRELGEYEIYNEYKWDEPWDSENNSQLIGSRCPRVYISPARPDHQYAAEANYFLVVGDGTLFPSTGPPLGPKDLLDGRDNTLLVVEAQNTTHEWSKPIDIDFQNLKGTANSVGVGGTHSEGFTASFADGVPGWFPNSTSPEQIRSMVTIGGGEAIDRSPFLSR